MRRCGHCHRHVLIGPRPITSNRRPLHPPAEESRSRTPIPARAYLRAWRTRHAVRKQHIREHYSRTRHSNTSTSVTSSDIFLMTACAINLLTTVQSTLHTYGKQKAHVHFNMPPETQLALVRSSSGVGPLPLLPLPHLPLLSVLRLVVPL